LSQNIFVLFLVKETTSKTFGVSFRTPCICNLELASRRSASFCQRRVLWLPSAQVRLCWRRDDRRLDAQRGFVRIISYGISRLFFASFRILNRPRDDRCRDAHRRFDNVVSYGVPGPIYYINMASCAGVAIPVVRLSSCVC
jgi:hypothetical protein